MKGIISSSEAVGQFEQDGKLMEVCATSEADYDESASRLLVTLDSFARPVDRRAREVHHAMPWLPKPQIVRETVDRPEAPELARDIFRRWAVRVRESLTKAETLTTQPL